MTAVSLPSLTRPVHDVQRTPTPVPWVLKQLMWLLAGTWLGAVGLLSSWYGVSGTSRYEQQVRWCLLGMLAVTVFGVAAAAWLLAGMRAVRIRQRRLEAVLGAQAQARLSRGAPASGATAQHLLVAGSEMRHFHRPDCLLARGRAVTVSSRAEHELAARSGCDICVP